MKTLKMMTIVLSLTIGGSAYAGGEKGNGGDFIRQIFIERGKEISDFLVKKESETSFLSRNGISSRRLKDVFRIEVVQVSSSPLTDNRGSAVDAIGSVGKIVLDQSSWQTYIIKGIKLDRMILHEALRAIGKNDDNYVVSEKAPALPSTYDRNSVSTGFRLLREEFSEAHFPSDAEIKSLLEFHLKCEKFTWSSDSPEPAFVSAEIEIWHSKGFKINWGRAEGYASSSNILYIDNELQSLSGFLDQNYRVNLRTRTGREFIAEISDSRDVLSPSAVSNQSLRAKSYYYCEANGLIGINQK